MEACERAGYAYFTTWNDLSRKEQVIIVAKYLIKISIEGHKNDAQVDAQKKRSKRQNNNWRGQKYNR